MNNNSIPRTADATTEEPFPGLDLLPQHAQQLLESGIAPDVAGERRYRSATRKTDLRGLGFGAYQARVPALVSPVWGIHGEIVSYQTRPDEPRVDRKSGRVMKYENPAGGRMQLDVPPRVRVDLGDPDVPIFITEGAKKVDSALSQGLACIGLLGVWAWRGTNAKGGIAALPELELIAWKGKNERRRIVYLAFDSDVMTKPEVHRALVRLRDLLKSLGARVRIIYLPTGPGGRKTGLDDFFVAGHTVDDLLALASDELRQPANFDTEGGTYVERDGGIRWRKEDANGSVSLVQLTNFVAEIVAEVTIDDGADEHKYLEIRATCGDVTRTFRLTPAEFSSMTWPLDHLGAAAWVTPGGRTIAERARVAIQELSKSVERRQVFGHTGWRRVGELWIFLHAGGAIDAAGVVAGVEVDLPEQLSGFALPPPPSAADLEETVTAVQRFLTVGPDQLTFPLLATVIRAVLRGADFAVHLEGESGTFKSELAALAQQFLGPTMTARCLPAAWSGTANSLERLAFAAKDVPLVVDDFVPRGSRADVQREHGKAERLLRAQGNRAGRSRMNADSTLRTTYFPRGAIISTGEDVPAGQSLLARLLVLHVAPSAIDPKHLTICQNDAATGHYALFLAAFIRWSASSIDDLRVELADLVAKLRGTLGKGRPHRRTPEIEANLVAALTVLGRFLSDSAGMTAEDVRRFVARGTRAIGAAVDDHSREQSQRGPHVHFLELLAAIISSGHGHIARRDGLSPSSPTRWGWRLESAGDETRERPMGDRLGYIEGDDLYLIPEAAYAAAVRFAGVSGGSVGVSQRILWKRMKAHGLLASTDASRGTNTVRRKLEDKTQNVVHIRADVLGVAVRKQASDPRLFDDGPSRACVA